MRARHRIDFVADWGRLKGRLFTRCGRVLRANGNGDECRTCRIGFTVDYERSLMVPT